MLLNRSFAKHTQPSGEAMWMATCGPARVILSSMCRAVAGFRGSGQADKAYTILPVKLWQLRAGHFTKRSRTFWRTIDTQSFWRGIASRVTAYRKTTGRHTSMRSGTVSWRGALNNHAIRRLFTTRGVPRRFDET